MRTINFKLLVIKPKFLRRRISKIFDTESSQLSNNGYYFVTDETDIGKTFSRGERSLHDVETEEDDRQRYRRSADRERRPQAPRQRYGQQ